VNLFFDEFECQSRILKVRNLWSTKNCSSITFTALQSSNFHNFTPPKVQKPLGIPHVVKQAFASYLSNPQRNIPIKQLNFLSQSLIEALFKDCTKHWNGFIAGGIVAQFATKAREKRGKKRKCFSFIITCKNSRSDVEHKKGATATPLRTPSQALETEFHYYAVAQKNRVFQVSNFIKNLSISARELIRSTRNSIRNSAEVGIARR
jgi:hypothetical protein